MIAEAIDRIKALAQATVAVQQFQISDRVYTDKPLIEVPNSLPALPGVLAMTTLGGFVDTINANIEKFAKGDVLIHVVSHGEVRLFERNSDKWGRCKQYAKAALLEVKQFPFGNYIDHESFLIGVQSGFIADGDRDYLLKIAANVTAEAVTSSEDDGVSQRVGLKAGAVLKTTELIKSRVMLAPFRTFREIQQPSSEFIFRVKQEGQSVPKMALFEADGGKWKIDAMEEIGRYLRAAVTDVPVIV